MSEQDKKEEFIEWVKNQEIVLKESIEGYKAVLEIEEQQISILLELKEMEEYDGERAKTIMIEFINLKNELRKKTMIEMKKFLEFNKKMKDIFPNIYS